MCRQFPSKVNYHFLCLLDFQKQVMVRLIITVQFSIFYYLTIVKLFQRVHTLDEILQGWQWQYIA